MKSFVVLVLVLAVARLPALPLAPPSGPEILAVDNSWAPLVPLPVAKVHAAGRPEGQPGCGQPLAWTASFSKGRVLQTRLGGTQSVRDKPEFLGAVTRGVEGAEEPLVGVKPHNKCRIVRNAVRWPAGKE